MIGMGDLCECVARYKCTLKNTNNTTCVYQSNARSLLSRWPGVLPQQGQRLVVHAPPVARHSHKTATLVPHAPFPVLWVGGPVYL